MSHSKTSVANLIKFFEYTTAYILFSFIMELHVMGGRDRCMPITYMAAQKQIYEALLLFWHSESENGGSSSMTAPQEPPSSLQ